MFNLILSLPSSSSFDNLTLICVNVVHGLNQHDVFSDFTVIVGTEGVGDRVLIPTTKNYFFIHNRDIRDPSVCVVFFADYIVDPLSFNDKKKGKGKRKEEIMNSYREEKRDTLSVIRIQWGNERKKMQGRGD